MPTRLLLMVVAATAMLAGSFLTHLTYTLAGSTAAQAQAQPAPAWSFKYIAGKGLTSTWNDMENFRGRDQAWELYDKQYIGGPDDEWVFFLRRRGG